MRGMPVVLLAAALLTGCGYQDESRPLVRGLGVGAGLGAVSGTMILGAPQGTAIGAAWGAGIGALGGYAVEQWSKTPGMGTLPPQFDGTVAVAPPNEAPPPVKNAGYKPFGEY